MKCKQFQVARCCSLLLLIGCTWVAHASVDFSETRQLLGTREEPRRVSVKLSWEGMGAILSPGTRIRINTHLHLSKGEWTYATIVSETKILAVQQADHHSATVVIAATPQEAAELAREQAERGDLWPVLIPARQKTSDE